MRSLNNAPGRLLISTMLVAVGSAVLVPIVSAAERDPSTTFGINGVATVPALRGDDTSTDVRAVAAMPDGGLVVGATSYGASSTHGYLRRLDAAGNVDGAYGSGGALDLGDGIFPTALTGMRDGRVVVGTGSSLLVTARDGRGTTTVVPGVAVDRLVALPDGRVAAFTRGQRSVVMIDPTGTVDAAFAGLDPSPSTPAAFVDGGVLPDGRLVLLENASVAPSSIACTVAVYRNDGSLDTSFGTNGIAATGGPTQPGRCQIEVEPTGSVLTLRDGAVPTLYRLPATGTSPTSVAIDPSLGINGSQSVGPTLIRVDGLGRIIFELNGRGTFVVLRSDGTLDPASAGFSPTQPRTVNGFAGTIDGGLLVFGNDRALTSANPNPATVAGIVTKLRGLGTTAGQPPVRSTARFEPLVPTRLLDTRDGIGAPAAIVGDGASIDVQATGRAGIPTSGVVAVVLNLAATNTAGAGFVTAWPTGTTRPTTANLNIERAGQTVSGAATVAVDASGRFSLFTLRAGDLIADVAGYYLATTSSTNGRYVPAQSPTRLLDTRDAGTTLAPGGILTLQITGRSVVPASGVSGVVLNLAATNTRADGYFTVWPAGANQPVAASLNVTAGETRSNLVIVPVGAGGAVSIYSQSGADVIVDVAGWFTDSTAPVSSSGLFVPIIPARILDTRYGAAPRPTGDSTITIPLAGGPRVPPATIASAVLINLTAVTTAAPGFFTAWPSSLQRPTVANLNASSSGQVIPNSAVVGLHDNGIDLYTQTGAHLVTDLFGYYLA